MSGKKTPVQEGTGKKGKSKDVVSGSRGRRSKPGFHLETPKERKNINAMILKSQKRDPFIHCG